MCRMRLVLGLLVGLAWGGGATLGASGLSEPPQVELRIGRGVPQHVAVSPDGRWIAVSTSISLELLDAETLEGAAVWSPTGLERMGAVVFSPTGQEVAACGNAGLVLWVPAAGRVRRVPRIRWPYPGHAVAFHPQGQLLAALKFGAPCRLGVVDLSLGVEVREVELPKDEPFSVAFSPDGKWLAVTMRSAVALYETDRWTLKTMLRWSADDVVSSRDVVPVGFSPDSALVAASTPRETRVWNVASGELKFQIPAYSQVVYFFADGQHLLISDWGEIRVVRLQDSGTPVRSWEVSQWGIAAAAVAPTGGRTAVLTRDRRVYVMQAGDPSVLALVGDYSVPFNGLAISPDGVTVAVAADDGTARLYSSTDGRPKGTAYTLGYQALDLSFAPGGDFLVVSSDGAVGVWETSSGLRIARLQGLTGQARTVQVSPDGRFVVAGYPELSVWEWGRWERLPVARLPTALYLDGKVAFPPDGRWLVVPEDRRVSIFQAGTWELVEEIPYGARACAAHPGGNLIAFARVRPPATISAGERVTLSDLLGSTVVLWSRSEGQARASVDLWHLGSVTRLAFSPDGRFLVAAAGQYCVLIDPETGQVVAQLPVHAQRITGLAFFPDGRRVATSSEDGTVAVIRIP